MSRPSETPPQPRPKTASRPRFRGMLPRISLKRFDRDPADFFPELVRLEQEGADDPNTTLRKVRR